jgi:hypothetical protein
MPILSQERYRLHGTQEQLRPFDTGMRGPREPLMTLFRQEDISDADGEERLWRR